MYATQIVKNVNGEDFTMAALVMQVNGFQFHGKIYIALDEGSDYYRIYGEKDGTTKEYHHDIAFDELGDVLDSMIETGGMTKEEYQAKVKDFAWLKSKQRKEFSLGQRIAIPKNMRTFAVGLTRRH